MSFPNTIPSALVTALEAKGYETLTDVQNAVLTDEADGRDLLVSAQTGSGKTVAFGMAMAGTLLAGEDRLPQAGAPLALIIAPTRELALQVQRELDWLYAEAGAKLASAVGGLDPRTERRALERGAHIVVGTPGRLRDHIERKALDLSNIRAIALDEADEMLDFGFREDLEFILGSAPEERRTLLFSATVSKEIARIAETYQRDALRISTLSATNQHADITYLAHTVAGHDRENAVINVLRYHAAPRALVFCATRDAVNRLAAKLHNRGFHAVALSGELTQAERTKALQALRDGRATVCVATDVAARGIDLPGLDLVVHAEPPTNAESLLHRSGRTGRAGAKGTSVFVVASSRKGRVIRLLREAKVQAEWVDAPDADLVREKDRERLGDHPALSQDVDEDRLEEIRELIERFGAEKLTAAFLSELERRMPAPEELSGTPPERQREERADRGPRRGREDFDAGQWFEIDLGRKQRAEPRWLVPLICRVGGIVGNDIGAIRIGETATRFQIAEDKIDGFTEAMNQPRETDKNVRVTIAGDEPFETAGPGFGSGPRGGDRDRGKPKRTPRPGKAERAAKRSHDDDDFFSGSLDDARGDTRPKRDWAPKGGKSGDFKKRDGERSYGDKPAFKKREGERSFGDKPHAGKREGFKKRDGGKPGFKKAEGGKPSGFKKSEGGDRPLKRIKRKTG
ncbi:DEAD/DEAH box helicase [Oceanicaulis sp. UBA6590]|uniref:DEAD/DEAH box helicase n=1 Tax=Oceanicaulis sp. UBA6590 TaxID=1947008 RepID=UPI0025CF9284|nr:DEAD/DEAH box helicase [Oceanicaulis sp. UBA6590]